MKRCLSFLLAGLLCLSLAGCGGGEKKPFDPQTTAQALVTAAGVFSEELEELDGSVLEAYYGLEGAQVAEAVGYCSTGATAEEVAVLRFESDKAAQAFEAKAADHLAYLKEANEDYRPQEMPKLEKALVERRGSTLLVLVAADYEAAQALLT